VLTVEKIDKLGLRKKNNEVFDMFSWTVWHVNWDIFSQQQEF
jgi:hypothetical protein